MAPKFSVVQLKQQELQEKKQQQKKMQKKQLTAETSTGPFPSFLETNSLTLERKRKRAEESIIDEPNAKEGFVGPQPSKRPVHEGSKETGSSSSDMLKDFTDDADSKTPKSLWDKQFRADGFIDKNLVATGDFEKFRKIGTLGLARWIEAHSLRAASIGRAIEMEYKTDRATFAKERDALKTKNTEMEEKLGKATHLITCLKAKVAKLTSNNIAAMSRAKFAEKNLEDAKKKVNDSETQLRSQRDLQLAIVFSKEKEKELIDDLIAQYEDGFRKAIEQAKFLHPDRKFDAAGPYMKIEDGRLVAAVEIVNSDGDDEEGAEIPDL